MNRSMIAALGAMTLLAAACGGSAADAGASPEVPISDPAAGSCLEGDPDCGTIGGDDPLMEEGELSRKQMLEAAAAVVGQHEDELPADVRVGRRGEEYMGLTKDYAVGRITVELDADQAGDFRVVAVTLEAADGPVQIGADGVVGELADEAARLQQARSLLGLPRDEVEEGALLRIGRLGDEELMLTMDYVTGRMTVEFDEDEAGELRVSSVVVELTDGPSVVTDGS